MKIEKTKLDGVLLITPDVFKDHRGEYIETFNDGEYYPLFDYWMEWVQDDVSVSYYNVLRGIHGDWETWKLVSCLHGTICLVVVNNMLDTPQYYEHTQFILSDQNRQQVLIPPGFGNGHYVMSDKAIFHYKQSTYYDSSSQFTIPWDHPDLGINWPIGKYPIRNNESEGYTPVLKPITSERDRGYSEYAV